MYKRVTGIYAIRQGNTTYYGSGVCTTGRINAHKRELRKGIHANKTLQSAYDKHGLEAFSFKVLEVCEREELRTLEQRYIDQATEKLFNQDLIVCELAPPEVHSLRMKKAWAKRTPEAKKAMAVKISETLKRKYQEDPEALKKAKDSLAKGREAGKTRKTSPEANAKRSEAAKMQWANRSATQKAEVAAKISKGMMETLSPKERSNRASIAAKARVYA